MLDQHIQGTSVITPRKKKEEERIGGKKEEGDGGGWGEAWRVGVKKKKKSERKGHEWQLI